ncbi:hypothetical protein RIF29_27873 [Crotalaria pallida]|uniref:non-specific serine/threonine protein kinase n=1 Tax=Crotalaria pallida TaxID=3830 RepID=A0AAN9EQV5_CROPI
MDSPNLDLNNLKALKVLGKGAMGTVFLVQHDTTTTTTTSSSTKHSLMALKVFHKTSTNSHHHHSDRRARWEIQVLSRFNSSHPFLPSLLGTFEIEELLGWALPYCPGGDLDRLRYRQTDHVFSPAVIRFYLAEILCALEHLHSIGIAYRDLKPENVLIDGSGHVTLTDFDLSRHLSRQVTKAVKNESKQQQLHVEESQKHHSNRLAACIEVPPDKTNQSKKKQKKRLETCRKHGYDNNFACTKLFMQKETNQNDKGLKKTKSARVSPVTRRKVAFTTDGERSNSFVGTEEYVSPEVVRGEGHEFAVDWWALGVLSYEMLYGTTPFKGKNRKETYCNVLRKEPVFVGKKTALTDLISRLLEKDPVKRLGYVGGASEIKEHEFFKGVKWDLLTEVVMRPPFIPSRGDDDDGFVGGCVGEDIRDYFQKLKSPPSSSPSPSSEFMNGVSFAEF